MSRPFKRWLGDGLVILKIVCGHCVHQWWRSFPYPVQDQVVYDDPEQWGRCFTRPQVENAVQHQRKISKSRNPLGVHPFVVQASRGSFKPKKKKEKMAARKRCGKVPVWCLWSAIVVQRAEPPPALMHIHKFQNLRILKQGATISFLKTPLAETKVSLYLLNQFSNKKTLF